eukprot:732602-Alexandrium_andersonii.AAC.1
MSASLVGSEMCIRDRLSAYVLANLPACSLACVPACVRAGGRACTSACAVSYTHLTLPTICSV